MRQVKHIPSGEQVNGDHDDGGGHGDDLSAWTWKRRKRKIKSSRQM